MVKSVEEAMKWIKIDPVTKCWIWTGRRRCTRGGGGSVYGELRNEKGAPERAHRFFFRHAKGPIPDNRELHHLCEESLCCKVEHLTVVSDSEHGQMHRQTHCKNGHERKPENVDRYGHCKICLREYACLRRAEPTAHVRAYQTQQARQLLAQWGLA